MASISALTRRVAKRLLRPFVKPLLIRIRAQQAQIDQFGQQVDQVVQHLPIVLNAISTQNATAREFERTRIDFAARLEDHEARLSSLASDSAARLADHQARLTALAEGVAYVDRRGEFIRREVMYEARYGARSPGIGHVDAQDFDVAGLPNPLRLNLGAGHVLLEGYVNVDARDLEGVDVVADVRKLPFEPGTVEEISSSHLVEHFPIEELRRVLLPHWFDLLRPGGRFVAVAPDAHAMVQETAAGRLPFDDFQRVMFGDQEYDGDFHFSTFTPDSFASLLAEVGFSDVEILERGRRNGLCYEFEVKGERPSVSELASEQVASRSSASTE